MKNLKNKPELTPEQLHNLMVSIGALDKHIEITGEKREKLITMFKMMEPVEQSNNQMSWTDTYKIGRRVFHVHYWPNEPEPTIEEFIKYKEPKRTDKKEVKSKLGYSRIGRNNV